LSKIQHLKELGITILQLDITDEKSLRECVAIVLKETGGGLDVLVNNAGIGE
jgi:NAD(P)-dependent dehydrogenase (short-subunit alcohol dehydrogenase family)